ncbi:ssDNA endodeoxyribonuclease [Balamuthia mandrillaris]
MSSATGQTESQEAVEVNFLAKIDNAKIISNLLSAIHLKKDQLATVTIENNGITFTVEESKVLQGFCFLQAELFQEYKRKDPSQQHQQSSQQSEAADGERTKDVFKINLSTMLDCLNIFGGTSSFTALQIMYSGYGSPVFLMLEGNGVQTDCGLRTLETDEVADFNFQSSPVLNKVIMKSESLREALNELDWSGDLLTLLLSPDPPYFRLATSSPSGSCQVDYPKDSEVFEGFNCTQTQVFSYKLKLLQPTVKALALAAKTQVRMNERGVLNLQHLFHSEEQTSFVNFYFVAQEDLEDSEEAEEGDTMS